MTHEMPVSSRILYHVSPAVNRTSINLSGLLPERAQGSAYRVYMCEDKWVIWAIAHVSARHTVSADLIDVYRCVVQDTDIRRFRGGIWYSWHAVSAVKWQPAINFIEAYKTEFVESSIQ